MHKNTAGREKTARNRKDTVEKAELSGAWGNTTYNSLGVGRLPG